MWVLSRQVGQTGYSGDDITATVVAVVGNPAINGIKASQEVAVHRKDIDRRIQKALRERETG